jgi:hypothetical protein
VGTSPQFFFNDGGGGGALDGIMTSVGGIPCVL